MLAITNLTVDVSQIVFGVAAVTSAIVGWRVRKDQKPNGGNSSRDLLDRIERRLTSIEVVQRDHTDRLTESAQQRTRLEERIDRLSDRLFRP